MGKQLTISGTPPCFICKEKPSVNQGFCNECIGLMVDEKIETEACQNMMEHIKSCAFCQDKIIKNGENI